MSLGEFIDDRLQSHRHNYQGTPSDGTNTATVRYGGASGAENRSTYNTSGRSGDTTEVKAVGVNFIIKY